MVPATPAHLQRARARRHLVLLLALAVGVGVFAFAGLALAQNFGLENLNGNVNLGNRPLLSTVGLIINVFLGFLGVVAVGLIL